VGVGNRHCLPTGKLRVIGIFLQIFRTPSEITSPQTLSIMHRAISRLGCMRVVCVSKNKFYWPAFLYLLWFVTKTANAVSIEFTGSRYEFGGVRYYFTVTAWEGGGHSFCNDMTAAECHLSLVGAQAPGQYWGLVISTHYWSGIKPSTSMAYVLDQMQRRGFSIPFKGSLFVPKDNKTSDSFCISFAQGYSYSSSGGVVAPVGPCVRVIKPALQCDIKGNTIINHRDVSEVAIDGSEASTTLQLTCSGVSSVIASANKGGSSEIKLRADGSLYSKLTIDGKPAGDGVSINVEEGLSTPVLVKSTLFSKGTVEPGEFSGSTVLTISPP